MLRMSASQQRAGIYGAIALGQNRARCLEQVPFGSSTKPISSLIPQGERTGY